MRRGVAIQEDQAGELGLQRLHLKYYKKRALKRLMNPELLHVRQHVTNGSMRSCASYQEPRTQKKPKNGLGVRMASQRR